MNNKEIVLWILLLIILGILTFLTPTLDSKLSGQIWVTFIVIVIAIVAIKLLHTLKTNKTIQQNVKVEKFKDNIVIKILWILFIISIIYEVIKYNSPGTITTIIILLIAIAYIGEWFLKKEE